MPHHRGRAFRKRVGGHDRFRRRMPAAGLRVGDQAVHDAGEFRRVERLADDAGRGQEHLGRLAAGGLAAISAVSLVAARPDLPVKALALPELTTSARARAALEPRAAPIDRRRRAFRAGEDAGHGGARVEQRQQHVGAPGIADAGRGGCQPHAGDRRHFGKGGGRERGDAGGHGPIIPSCVVSASLNPSACPDDCV